jgi:hypothetical protein
VNLSAKEKEILKDGLNRRTFDTLIGYLERRKLSYIKIWQSNFDEKISAHYRGRVNEVDELIEALSKLHD